MDWYPWCEEAFEKARTENKPVFLSIGYSSCHWCHVMAHESFDDPGIAKFLSDNFVCIKVDREERPDLDRRYMLFIQMITGTGGWPLSVFMTPEKAPFFGGTYFPPEDRYRLPSFSKVLRAVLDMFRKPVTDLGKSYREINKRLDRIATVKVDAPLTPDLLKAGFEEIKEGFDNVNGGLIGSPKFPQFTFLQFLLRLSKRFRDPEAYQHAELTARKMCRGGVYDQVGGGLHRYSVDAFWRVPHFEKMLYDQAKMVLLLCDLHQAAQEDWVMEYLVRTADFIISDMRAQDGFASAIDADSPDGEGRYYVWKEGELRDLFGEMDFKFLSFYFDTTMDGNFEDGCNVISMPFDDELVAQRFELNKQQLKEKKSEIFSKLYRRRLGRKAPVKDQKKITSWNALTCSALLRVAVVTGRQEYTEGALKVCQRLKDMADSNQVTRTLDGGGPAFLEDLAFAASALLDAYLVTGDSGFLEASKRMVGLITKRYYDPETSILFFTPIAPTQTGERMKDYPYDQEMPSATAEFAKVMLRLHALEPDAKYQAIASRILSVYHKSLRSPSVDTANLLCALDIYFGPQRVAVLEQGEGLSEMKNTIASIFDPNLMLLVHGGGGGTPLTQGKTAIGGRATAYLCENGTCKPPITDPGGFMGIVDPT